MSPYILATKAKTASHLPADLLHLDYLKNLSDHDRFDVRFSRSHSIEGRHENANSKRSDSKLRPSRPEAPAVNFRIKPSLENEERSSCFQVMLPETGELPYFLFFPIPCRISVVFLARRLQLGRGHEHDNDET